MHYNNNIDYTNESRISSSNDNDDKTSYSNNENNKNHWSQYEKNNSCSNNVDNK